MCYKKIRGADSWKLDCSSRGHAGKLGQRHRKWGQLMSDGKLNWTVGSRTVVGRNSAIFKSYGQVWWWNWYDLQEEIKKDPRSLGFTAGDIESYPCWFDSAWAILFGPELSLCHVLSFISNSSDLLPFLIMMAKFWVSTWLVLSPGSWLTVIGVLRYFVKHLFLAVSVQVFLGEVALNQGTVKQTAFTNAGGPHLGHQGPPYNKKAE